jgi:uncharacterized membrane protein HdeD (DUF308 family)
MTDKSLETVAAKWWVMLLRGMFAIASGITALARPGLTLITLILLYGIYVIADSITTLSGSRLSPLMIVVVLAYW